MYVTVTFTNDPGRVLKETHSFLAVDPVRNNIMVSLLSRRVSQPEEGRYWVAKRGEAVVGVVFNSPLPFPALAICADRETIEACVESIVGAGISLTGVNGAAATAAVFAGQWTEATNSGAVPTRGTRLYEATGLRYPSLPAGERRGEGETSGGRLRLACPDDRQLLLDGLAALMVNSPFQEDVEKALDRRMKSQDFWVWEVDGKGVSMAASNKAPLEGVIPINAVYTPPELRGRGYATACTAALASRILADGSRCILYTNLGNPTANSIYRRIGFRAVEESLMYRFAG